jgi:hypothetical protein
MITNLEIFSLFEKFALGALADKNFEWDSLEIDYHKPYVNRIWIKYNDWHICLHEILPCERSEALIHAHPWEADFKVYEGGYRMDMGFGINEPEIMQEMVLPPNSMYSMTDPNAWHCIYPSSTVYSIMVSRTPYGDKTNPNCKKSDKKLEPMSDSEVQRLKSKFINLLSKCI